jgi:excisionase family DNA binding protein
VGEDKLLRVNVAARRLGLSERQVRRLINAGRLPAVRQGERQTRVPAQAVENFRSEEE